MLTCGCWSTLTQLYGGDYYTAAPVAGQLPGAALGNDSFALAQFMRSVGHSAQCTLVASTREKETAQFSFVEIASEAKL